MSNSTTPSPYTMPAAIHGEEVVSAFRHLPSSGRVDFTFTVITRTESTGRAARLPDAAPRYSVFRARWAPLLSRWSIDTDYEVSSGLAWAQAARLFARITTQGAQTT